MRAKLLIAVAAICLFLANSATASVLLIPSSFEDSVPNSGNNFNVPLTGLGFDSILSGDIMVTTAGTVTFRYHGAESAFDNKFLATGGVSGTVDFEQFGSQNWDATGVVVGSIDVAAGETLDLAFDSNIGAFHAIGTPEFGIFANLSTGSFFGSDGRAYFGHDDNGAGPDDNHDDIIISAEFTQGGFGNIVPEPGSALIWASLGLAGLVSTRRRNR